MKFELNFVANRPTLNGRVYNKESLKEVLSKIDIPVTAFPLKNAEVDMSKVIGWANLTEFTDDKIEFEVSPVNHAMLESFKGKKLTTTIIGEVKRIDIKDVCGLVTSSRKEVTDMTLINLFPAIISNENHDNGGNPEGMRGCS